MSFKKKYKDGCGKSKYISRLVGHLPRKLVFRSAWLPYSLPLYSFAMKPAEGNIYLSTTVWSIYMSADTDIAVLEAKIVTQTAKFNELRVSGHPHDDAMKSLSGRLTLAKSAGKSKDVEGKRDGKEVVKERKRSFC
jgi:hypothetical protein